MNRILFILKQIRPEADYTASDDFIEDGLLDSFDLVTFVSDLDKTFSISIEGVDIVPENFANLASITSLLEKYGVRA